MQTPTLARFVSGLRAPCYGSLSFIKFIHTILFKHAACTCGSRRRARPSFFQYPRYAQSTAEQSVHITEQQGFSLGGSFYSGGGFVSSNLFEILVFFGVNSSFVVTLLVFIAMFAGFSLTADYCSTISSFSSSSTSSIMSSASCSLILPTSEKWGMYKMCVCLSADSMSLSIGSYFGYSFRSAALQGDADSTTGFCC